MPLKLTSRQSWRLCQTLDSHHRSEDAFLFPAVRRTAPQLARTVDRLEADHRIVAELIGEIEKLANELPHRSTKSSRSALVQALEELSTNLNQHLDLEEMALQPVLESWSNWPEDAPAEIRDEMARRGH